MKDGQPAQLTHHATAGYLCTSSPAGATFQTSTKRLLLPADANDHNSDNPGDTKSNGGDIGSYQP